MAAACGRVVPSPIRTCRIQAAASTPEYGQDVKGAVRTAGRARVGWSGAILVNRCSRDCHPTHRIGCIMLPIPRRSSAVPHLAPLRAVLLLLLALLAGCKGVALKEPACLTEARTGADQLAALPASARTAVSNALAGECQSPGVACGYHVGMPEQGALGGEISVRVRFVRGDEEGCLYMPGDGKAWRFTTQGELIGEDLYL